MSREVELDYTNYETLGEIKNKYPDSTFVMRKQFIDMAIQHEWNHGRPVGNQLGISTELDPRCKLKCNAAAIARTMVERLDASIAHELENLLSTLADEFGKLHVRVTFYKEPRL